MKINIEIEPLCNEIEVKIITPEMNEEVQSILKNLKERKYKQHIVGIKNERIYLLNQNDIYYFYSENKKVFASLKAEDYEVKQKLYELEEELQGTSFIRVSKSVIANMNKVLNLEMFFNGSMCINLINGKKEYASRKFVSRIKKYLECGVG
ncbi:response regulator, LytTR family protein [Clostridium botulinum]|uniref:LytTR family DNA-binding domain-containing protein n=1 Tax=Clostridium botulinum TaxID=1491 RepID=UPI0004DB005A|nr:LytTR family DNA-binding domain-containing protein [Clostridium botulinum]KEI02552.1 response regulator, LytTR family protein [Clostridium botulinum D str. 16868]KOA77262.1 response regulator, LytTR family protein [Clostridium botulinum]NFF60879.1 LytTR family transcriptional regulator [Clostridium botulinum]NFL03323.1 LytTR family transcriptional regulator [Clostridium botulinum]